MKELVYVFVGGGLGSLLRYFISLFFTQSIFPFSTLISNILSCLLLVLAVEFLNKSYDGHYWTLFLIIGFCGGFSTFSTFSYETLELFKNGRVLYAFLNICINTLVCFLIFYFFIEKS